MKLAKFLSIFGLLSIISSAAAADQGCNACNIVQEYGIRGIGVGSTYRNFDGNPITIVQVDYSSSRVLVYPAGYPNARRSWIPAENIYTDQRLFERQQTAGLIAACALYRSARDEGSLFGAVLLRGACCDSSAARRYGAPRDLC